MSLAMLEEQSLTPSLPVDFKEYSDISVIISLLNALKGKVEGWISALSIVHSVMPGARQERSSFVACPDSTCTEPTIRVLKGLVD